MSAHVHTITVEDPIGLHARPVGQIVTLVRDKGATVTLRSAAGAEAIATSALKMLALKVKTGETLEIVIDSAGSSDPETLAGEIEKLINQG